MTNGTRDMFAPPDAEFKCCACELCEVPDPLSLCDVCHRGREAEREWDRRAWFLRANVLMNASNGRFPINVCMIIDEFLNRIH